MSFESSSIVWSAKQVTKMIENNKIGFTNLVQRGLVWENERKSLFVHSTMIDFPIPEIYAKRNETGETGETDEKGRPIRYYDILDGKQRMTTLADYINGKFKLKSNTPTVTCDGVEYEVSEKFFEELPEELQDKIKDAKFKVVYFDSLLDDEEKELFKRLNNGKALTAKNKALACCNNIEDILEFCKHPIFDELLSEKKLENKEQVVYAKKSYDMLFKDVNDVSFEGKKINKDLETFKMEYDEKVKLEKVFDLMMNTHTVFENETDMLEEKEDKARYKKLAKKLYTEIHFISLIPFAGKAVDLGKNEDEFSEFVKTVFDTDNGYATNSDAYNTAITDGTAKTPSIVARHEALQTEFEKFFS